jgi:hypothetical protein
MRIELLWPDGGITTGSSWARVEAAMRAAQPRTYKSRREFRAAMRHRARVWSGRRQKPYPPWNSEAFVKSLAASEMFLLYVHPEPPTKE